MVFPFSRKKKKKRRGPAKVRVSAPPAGHASGKVSPRGQGPKRAAPQGKRPAAKKPAVTPVAPSRPSLWNKRSLAGLAVRTGFTLFIIGGVVLMYFMASLPDIRDLNTIKKQQGITVETEDGRIIATYGDVYGAYVPYDKIPKSLINAVIATEDRRFFQHHGVDFFGILRAMVVNVTSGKVRQGASTVTQQVAKNVFLSPERTVTRKIREMLLAFWLEGRYSKEEIMAIYLNRVYLGSGTFGIDAASRRYFNKPATDMDLVESAMIAGLLKAPSRYAPTASSERAMARAHQVLKNMADNGALSEKEIKPALKKFAEAPRQTVEGSHVRYYGDWVVDQLPELIGNLEDDIVVVTTFDPAIQENDADALENTLSMEGDGKKVSQGAIVTMSPDGAVRAMIGGKSYGESQYNRAAQAKRQPGSLFKLFVYLAALEAGYTPMAQVDDAPISIQVGNKIWSPRNYTGQYKGPMTVAQAFRESINTVAVRLSQYAGVNRVAQMAERLGLSEVARNPSIALGAEEATLVEMTAAFAHMPNGGNAVVPYGILEVHTTKGEEVYKREAPEPNPVLAEGTVKMMNYLMLGTVRGGTGGRAALPGRDVAGKTGTTSDYKDAWFVGFTNQLVTGVWVGNDNNRPMAKVTGGAMPASIWHDAMIKDMEGKPVETIASAESSGSGLLPWLFGTSTPAAPAAAIPADSPFAVMNEDDQRAMGAPLPPGSQPVPVQPAPAPAPQEGPTLDQGFWDKLMNEAPKMPKVKLDGKVEYDYPTNR
jgi:penicillin-binding protein 1A